MLVKSTVLSGPCCPGPPTCTSSACTCLTRASRRDHGGGCARHRCRRVGGPTPAPPPLPQPRQRGAGTGGPRVVCGAGLEESARARGGSHPGAGPWGWGCRRPWVYTAHAPHSVHAPQWAGHWHPRACVSSWWTTGGWGVRPRPGPGWGHGHPCLLRHRGLPLCCHPAPVGHLDTPAATAGWPHSLQALCQGLVHIWQPV